MEFIQQDSSDNIENVCIMLHGLGADGNDLTELSTALKLPKKLNTRFVYPHAPTIKFSANHNLPCSAWYDFDDKMQTNFEQLASSVNDIIALIQQQMDEGIAGENITIGGFSQGGSIALHVGMVLPIKLAGVFSIASFLPDFNRAIGTASDENKDTPFLLMHGTEDKVIEINHSEQAKKNLSDNGYSHVDFKSYEGIEHGIDAKQITELGEWLTGAFSK